MAGTQISTRDVKQAAAELARMRGSLRAWLTFRARNDAVLAGQVQTKHPLPYAQQVIAQRRDMGAEQDLAAKLHALLEALDVKGLPNADVRRNPDVAVQLAQIALAGGQSSSPSAQGGLFASPASHPWLWPVLIVGGLLIVITTAIKSAADVAKDKEEKACIEAGACTDTGFWLKAGGVVIVAWFAWKELGLGEYVKGRIRKGRS